jgi:hypothetical protein
LNSRREKGRKQRPTLQPLPATCCARRGWRPSPLRADPDTPEVMDIGSAAYRSCARWRPQ